MIPIATLMLLLGAFLPLPDLPTAPDPDDDDAQLDYHRQMQRRALLAVARLGLLGAGSLLLLIGVISGLGEIQVNNIFGILLALFTGLILLVQRAEVNRRLATLAFMSFCGLLVWNYAAYRDAIVEARGALLAALLANLLFWLLIGRRYPPGSSQSIQVWGMDES